VRIPDHLPKGKTVRIRCSRCQHSFPLSLGKLFPQEARESYQALVDDSLACEGTMVGRLWLEKVGSGKARTPVVALPAHPSLPHDVLHDLLDSLADYFPVCYLEFPGTRRNSQELEGGAFSNLFLQHLDRIKQHLGAARFHLLAHLCSAAVALEAVIRKPDSIASLILVEPHFCLAEKEPGRAAAKKLHRILRDSQGPSDTERLLLSFLQDVWDSGLPERHAEGLAKILAPGVHLQNLRHDLVHSRSSLRYSSLSRKHTPVLILHSRDSGLYARRDSLFLQETLPAVQSAAVEQGGAWAPWFHNTWFATRLMSFKRGAGADSRPPPRRRCQTLSGQPLGWMAGAFVLLAVGLARGLSFLPLQPDFMASAIPPLLAGLLPILWFLVPRRINPLAFVRFRGFSPASVLLPLVVGIFVAVFFRSLLLTLGRVSLSLPLPPSLSSISPGSPGRLVGLSGIAVMSLFVFGVAQNLWIMRRSTLQILIPTLLFALVPPSFPDILWRLPLGFAAAILFAGSLSIYSVLFLLAGFAAASELPVPIGRVAISWHSVEGVALTTAVLGAAVLLAIFLGTGWKPVPPEVVYFRRTINAGNRSFRWEPGSGIVVVIFSLIASAGLIFAFLAA
jgi:pimeloyl-ACP methyl ester carboxylesterase